MKWAAEYPLCLKLVSGLVSYLWLLAEVNGLKDIGKIVINFQFSLLSSDQKL